MEEDVSVEKTEDSNFITIKCNEHNLYIDVYDDGEIIISAFKNKSITGNWSGTINELINQLNKKK